MDSISRVSVRQAAAVARARRRLARRRAGAAKVAKGLRWKRWALYQREHFSPANRGLAAFDPQGAQWRPSGKGRLHAALGMSDTDPRRPVDARWDERNA